MHSINNMTMDDGLKEEFVDITFYHLPKSVINDFKEYCKLYSNNKFGAGLSQLLFIFKDKITYFSLLERVARLEEQVIKLIGESSQKEDIVNQVKTFGGVLK